jgi:hypothetical protein
VPNTGTGGNKALPTPASHENNYQVSDKFDRVAEKANIHTPLQNLVHLNSVMIYDKRSSDRLCAE